MFKYSVLIVDSERFKRGDKSRNKEGSGLELGIAKSIAELQGGKLDIGVDNERPMLNINHWPQTYIVFNSPSKNPIV